MGPKSPWIAPTVEILLMQGDDSHRAGLQCLFAELLSSFVFTLDLVTTPATSHCPSRPSHSLLPVFLTSNLNVFPVHLLSRSTRFCRSHRLQLSSLYFLPACPLACSSDWWFSAWPLPVLKSLPGFYLCLSHNTMRAFILNWLCVVLLGLFLSFHWVITNLSRHKYLSYTGDLQSTNYCMRLLNQLDASVSY